MLKNLEPYEQLELALALEPWTGPGREVVACSSGTAALHLALEALDLPPGSGVLVPTFTMVACARAVTLAGLRPVFVDCAEDLLLDLDLVDEALADQAGAVRAVLPVHVYGRAVDMDALHALAVKYDLVVVEDLAEAHGLAPHPATDAACWSFYRNKVVAGEEGGAVAFRDPAAAGRARELRCLGFTAAHDFRHRPRGHNYRLANALAELILTSLLAMDDHVKARRAMELTYDDACPPGWRLPARQVPWVYDFRIPGQTSPRQERSVRLLQRHGLAARHAFQPMHRQEEYSGCNTYLSGAADRLASEVLYLPLSPATARVSQAVLAFDLLREDAASYRRAG